MSIIILMSKYKTFDHTADIGIEITGKTRKELFGNAVMAMFDVMVGPISEGEKKPLEKMKIKITGKDIEDTLINFLREILYLLNGKGWLTKKCKILALSNREIVTQLQGELYNDQKYALKTEIKAVTYHGLTINKSSKGWRAKVVFDV